MRSEVKMTPKGSVWIRHLEVFFCALLCIGLYATVPARAESVRVALPAKSMTFTNFYVGEKFGFYKAEGLEVSIETVKAPIGVAGVVAGEIDYMAAIHTVMTAAAAGQPLKAVMISMDKAVSFMMAKPSIRSIGDLKGGKTVAVTGGVASTPAQAAQAMARSHGLDPGKDLVFISMPDTADVLAALQSGAVDVGMLSIPFNFRAEALGLRSLGNAVDYLSAPFAGVGTSDAKLKSNPNQVKRMIRATLKAMDFMKDAATQERVIAYMAEEFKLDRNTAMLSCREIVKALTKDGTTTDDAVNAEIELIRTEAKIKRQVRPSQIVDYTLLKEVLAEMKR